jgi:hypothetical protein
MRFLTFDAEESRYARTVPAVKRGKNRRSPNMGRKTYFLTIIGNRPRPPAI